MSSTDIVRAWMRNAPVKPTVDEVKSSISGMLDQWHTDKRDGYDVLASAGLDEIVEIVTALRDL